MKLTEVIPYVVGLLDTAEPLKSVPRALQTDRDYNKKFEAALRNPGLCFVLWLTGGHPQEDAQNLDAVHLENLVTIAVVENPETNNTERDALALTELLLTSLHHAGRPVARGPRPLKMDMPTYDLGPLRTGLVTYFVTFRVKSANPLTPLTP